MLCYDLQLKETATEARICHHNTYLLINNRLKKVRGKDLWGGEATLRDSQVNCTLAQVLLIAAKYNSRSE
jgi:hypothetical protein